jgi:hypothetical protein
MTGNMTDESGMLVSTYMGLERLNIENMDKTDKIIELKKAGFLVEDILKLKREGVI